VAPRVHILLVDVSYQIPGNAVCAYQVRYMHIHVVTPGQSLLRLSHARAKSEILSLPNFDHPTKGDNHDRRHRPSRTARGWAWGRQLHHGKNVTKTEEATAGRTILRRDDKHIKDLRTGSWTVLSLYKPGALKLVLQQLDSSKVHIAAIQKIRCTGKGIMEEDQTIFIAAKRKRMLLER
jgi:hypothetical protein